MKRRPLMLAGLTAANLVVAFLSLGLVMTVVGPGTSTDALFAGLAVPQVIIAIVGGSLQSVLVPLLSSVEPGSRRQVAWSLFLLASAGFAVLCLLLFLSAPRWVPLLVPGFDPFGQELAVALFRIQIIGVVFTALSGVLTSVYQSYQRFIWPELASLLAAICAMGLLVLLLPRYGVVAAAWLSVARAAAVFTALVPVLGRYGGVSRDGAVYRTAWQRIRPLLVSTSYFKTGPIVDKYLLSMAASGGLSLMHFGQQICDAIGQIIYRAITAPMVPVLATHARSSSWSNYRRIYRRQLVGVFVVTAVIYAALLFFSAEVIRLFVTSGRLRAANGTELSHLLAALGGYVIAGGMGQILASSFYAKGNTLVPSRVGIAGFTLGLILKVVGLFKFGLVGFAAAASLHQIFNTCAMWIVIEKRLAQHLRANGLGFIYKS